MLTIRSCTLGASRNLRPALPASRAFLAVPLTAARKSSNLPAEDPKKTAQSLIDAIPGNSMISKAAILSTASALGVYALSNEFYVVNEETVIAFCLITVWVSLIKFGGPRYKQWAEAQNDKIRSILNQARTEHTDAVKSRIETVKEMGGVVDVTKTLFEVSKVRTAFTVVFEHEVFWWLGNWEEE